ncbi:fungal-specific transcription factor domain-containing protein [Mycena metata]|uniref:Fungal-specific transcription factor domain-containing protein n=1 Tax=Mycena metata TaxID=1033252 RepID=A0AAD7I4K5_9AGAR|nr:fungal-specific transcription factor domain-containing protein [Mycena metata]
MSSDEDYEQDFHRGKKRRIQRACDVCRRRKSDGSQVSGDKCTTCSDANLDCTYLETTAKRPPPKSYVDSLETRLERSEALVRQLRSELAAAHFRSTSASTTSNLNSNANLNSTPNSNSSASPPNSETAGNSNSLDLTGGAARRGASLLILRAALQKLNEPAPAPYGDDLVHLDIAADFQKLKVDALPERRFIGKSSGAALIKAAIDLREDVKREERQGLSLTNGHTPDHPAYNRTPDDGDGDGDGQAWKSRRMRFWTFRPWENTAPRTHAFTFPPVDLLAELVGLYFTHQNIYVPLLHRPTFERGIVEGLHLRDNGFGATVLLVCAVGSRWSTDPRVVPTVPRGCDGEMSGLACGWEWFDQVPLVGNHMFGQATLYDLQYYCLAVQFLMDGSAPQACWTLIGVGLRLAQDIGAHRRNARVEVPSVEGELFKRAFWALVYMDRIVSCGMGRPCAMQYDDFDLELPIDCNDEYWEHPERPFQQPPGVPSPVLYFNAILGLNNLLAACLKLLYSLSKVRAVFSMDDTGEENIVAELDSALNKWRDQVPEHLRWDPERADPLFFDQSVALHCAYNWLQILIHRPFIPMVRKSAPTALPSLAICTSAARACANMLDIQRRRKGNVAVIVNLPSAFISGIILLLNVWSGKRTGLVPDPSREMVNVHKCMEVMRLCEDRWQGAGLLWDILAELASVGQLPLPQASCADPEHHHEPVKVKGASRYPICHIAPMPPEVNARIMLGARGLRQTFDRPIYDSQFQAPYAPLPQPATASFAGGIGGDSRTFGPAPMEPSAFAPAPAPEAWSPPEDPFAMMHTDPAQASRELGEMMNLIDSDTIAMWTSAPNGYEVENWGNYFNDFNEITQGQYQGS